MYVDYKSSMEMCGIESLHMRREHRSLQFALKCRKQEFSQNMFPLNHSTEPHCVRNREKYKANRSNTEAYKNSTIPFFDRGSLMTISCKIRSSYQGHEGRPEKNPKNSANVYFWNKELQQKNA